MKGCERASSSAGMRFGVAVLAGGRVSETVERVRLVENLGFDSVWLNDSQVMSREVFVALAACATATSRIKLATGVTVPGTRHPTVTASAFGALQELSNGRIVAGIGKGNVAVRGVGIKPMTIRELADYVATLRLLMSGQEATLATGAVAQIAWLEGVSHIPVYVAASGPRMTVAAAAMGDGVVLFQGASEPAIMAALERVDQGRRSAGKARDSVNAICWAALGIDHDQVEARRSVRSRVAAIVSITNPLAFDPSDREAVIAVRDNYESSGHASAEARHLDFVSDSLIDRYAIAGTPAEVRARIARLSAIDGISQIVLSPPSSNREAFERAVQLFADEVLNHPS